MKISEFIASYRELNKLSQEDFGKRVGVKKQTVCKWESGKSEPNSEKLFEISKVTGVPMHILVDEELLDKMGAPADSLSYNVGLNVLHNNIYNIESFLYFMNAILEIQDLLGIRDTLGGILYLEKFMESSEFDAIDDATPFVIDSIDFEHQEFTLFSEIGILSFNKNNIKDIEPYYINRNELYIFDIQLDDEKMSRIQMCFFAQR